MPKIYEMPPHLADLIAAGEVVERPSSVVKELCENSIDAGASMLTVEIKNGGMELIRVTDNGCGIAPEDAETAFLRHATSKLTDERGLEAIGTLGFRGEALAAIASVSRVELLTREAGAADGTRLLLEGGEVNYREAAGCPEGTTIAVRSLFYNTPARLKYMKTDKAESSAVLTTVTRLALAHPEVSIKYIRDGREELHTPGDGKTESAIYAVLGRDLAKNLLRAESGEGSVRVTGYISAPAACRGNRSWQFFFVNGRFIKSKLLQAALEQAYKNALFTGKFPACVLNIGMSLSAVDVNVHPTKTEVRFVNEREVFDAVYWACKGAIEREDRTAELEVSKSTENAVRHSFTPDERPAGGYGGKPSGTFSAAPRGDFYKTVSAEAYRTTYAGGNGGFRTSVKPLGAPKDSTEVSDFARAGYQTRLDMPAAKPLWQPEAPIIEDAERHWRYIGEAMTTYLIVESGESVYLIDKHAAHERILFDKLKANPGKIESQMLLTPITASVGAESAELIAENAELLMEFGVEAEDFGGGSVVIRQVPADISVDDPAAFVEELATALSSGGRRELSALRDDIMHTVACRAAIKAGKRSEPASVAELIEKVISGEVRYCPHGRPVMMELTKSELDRAFKRIS